MFNTIVLILSSLAFVSVESQLFYDNSPSYYGNDGSWQLDSEMPTMVKYINVREPTRYRKNNHYVGRPASNRHLSALMHTPLIFGGDDARNEEVPWLVSFRKNFTYGDPRGKHFCGGTIISDRWIITAASCLHRKKESKVVAIAGTNKLSTGGDIYAFERFFIHPRFDPDFPGVDDIALAKTVSLIQFNRKVQYIRVLADSYGVEDFVIIAGFGITLPGEDMRLSNDLQIGRVEITSCIFEDSDNDKQICASRYDSQIDTCAGDIGGPMLTEDAYLIGIITEMSCGAFEYASVYVRVANYASWIKKTT